MNKKIIRIRTCVKRAIDILTSEKCRVSKFYGYMEFVLQLSPNMLNQSTVRIMVQCT